MRTLLRPTDKVRLLAVSIDDHDKTKGLLEKIAADGKGQLGFPVLADPGAKVINLYGLQDHRYDGKSYDDGKIQLSGIPYDSFYLIDKNGKIVWTNIGQDYKVHPSNASIRAEIDKLKK